MKAFEQYPQEAAEAEAAAEARAAGSWPQIADMFIAAISYQPE